MKLNNTQITVIVLSSLVIIFGVLFLVTAAKLRTANELMHVTQQELMQLRITVEQNIVEAEEERELSLPRFLLLLSAAAVAASLGYLKVKADELGVLYRDTEQRITYMYSEIDEIKDKYREEQRQKQKQKQPPGDE